MYLLRRRPFGHHRGPAFDSGFSIIINPANAFRKNATWQTKLDEIVKKAPEWDIGIIAGVPAWLQILLERIIETYQVNTIHNIWPNLSIFVHEVVAFTPYEKGFENSLARPITYMETYPAFKDFFAFQNRVGVR